ncbi:DUF2147 domain-containing protein [uncultured Tateyamaria sp.]|uniref:DUF2147 domain-containing protein n=1 Tax=uncultured Tateyamaria sp. TaxID=455651 RepID=UPI001D49181D|nr:DUF2147 domain-containing protein [uncultured Tateyamaria sp.]MCB4379346.1 DUF2147 domain-containing protein [Synechococcus sp. MU1644]
MKHLIAAACVAIASAGAAMADPVLGTWKTEVDDGAYAHIAMSTCGAKICGTIAKAFDASGPIASENVGKQLVWDMEPQGGGSYASGKIWQPSTGKVFKSKMALSGNSLNVSGCVGPFCKKQTWSRVN